MSEVSSDADVHNGQHFEDLDSCLGYLKKREVFLYKMMNDPNHKAMLYFLEVLLNSDHPISINDLVDKFYCKNFTPDMREACGNNVQGLKQFLERYPSLFDVNENTVSAVAVDKPTSISSISNCSSPPMYHSTSITNGVENGTINSDSNDNESDLTRYTKSFVTFEQRYDFTMETEAVKFFQLKMLKRDEKWVPVRSLAGHLSQASNSIRQVVGPQLDFKKFLLRHPHMFEVQGELVSLKDNFPSQCLTRKPRNVYSDKQPLINGFHNVKSARPKSLNVANNEFYNSPSKDPIGATSAPTTPSAHNNGLQLFTRSSPLSMTGNEYRAIMFLRKVIEKKDGTLSLSNLFLYLGKSSETIRNVIGWTKFELQEFIRKNSVFFEITPNEMVVNKKANRINVIITGANTSGSDSGTRTLTNRCGKVFHVAKLWGIIDLGKHEHVFFDKSIFKHLDDLQRHFKIGEVLYFNAILAPKESRAKWRATQVWKESDREMVERFSGNILTRNAMISGILCDGLSDVTSVVTEPSEDDMMDDIFDIRNESHLLPDEIEEELIRILKSTKSDDEDTIDSSLNTDKILKNDKILPSEDDDNQSTYSMPSVDYSSHHSIKSDPSIASHPLSAPAASFAYYNNHNNTDNNNSNNNNNHNNYSNNATTNQNNVEVKNYLKKSIETNSIIISSKTVEKLKEPECQKKPKMLNAATQTLSTGDIMATNLFHE